MQANKSKKHPSSLSKLIKSLRKVVFITIVLQGTGVWFILLLLPSLGGHGKTYNG